MYQDDRNEESCTLIDAKRQSLRDYVACDENKREREFEKRKREKGRVAWTFLLLFLFPANFLLFTRAHVQGEQRAEVLIARRTVIYVGCIRNSLGQVADDV